MTNNVMTKGSQPMSPGPIPQSGGNDNRLPNRETQPAGGAPAPATAPPATMYPCRSSRNKQPRWGHFLIGAAILIAGYGIDILYCNNWHLVDPNHVPSGYTGIIAFESVFIAILIAVLIMYIDEGSDRAIYILPIFSSLTAVVAGAAGLPISSWITHHIIFSFAQESVMFILMYLAMIQLVYITNKYIYGKQPRL